MHEKTDVNKRSERAFFTTRTIVQLAVFTALSYILYMFVKVPLPMMFPSFLEIQISEVPGLLAGFMMGPAYGAVVILIKCILKLPFSHTVGVGELADLLIGLAFVLPAAFIYKRKRTKKGALIGLGAGLAASTAMAVVANGAMLIPFYVNVSFGGNWEILLDMMRGLFPQITVSSFYAYYLPLSVLPFNLLRGILSALVCFLLYKSLEKALNRLMPVPKKPLGEQNSDALSVANRKEK